MPIAAVRRRIAVASEDPTTSITTVTEDGTMDGPTAAAVLGITQEATKDEIRRAFRARAKVAHPDARGTSEAFVTLRAAADVLLAAAPDGPSRQAPCGTGRGAAAPEPIPGPMPPAVDAPAGPGAGTTGACGLVGRRATRWERPSVTGPGAAIDLTDRPVGSRFHRPAPASAETAAPASSAADAFGRVLEAELARR